MRPNHQRLIFIIFSILLLLFSVFLILSNIRSNVIFLLTPSELKNEKVEYYDKIRIGGIVKPDSIETIKNSNEIKFIISDNISEINVSFVGIPPDLFKEGSGVVAEGTYENDMLISKKIYAKHDENYMPSDIAEQLKKNNKWNINYK